MTTIESLCLPDLSQPFKLPLFVESVSAGSPSPIEGWVEGRLDLNRYLVRHPAATFFVRVMGDSMVGAGIETGDILIVDRAVEPYDRCVVIAMIDDEFTVKRLSIQGDRCYLMPENNRYRPIILDEERGHEIWGVVTNVVHRL